MLWGASNMCIEPPRPFEQPVDFPYSSAISAFGLMPFVKRAVTSRPSTRTLTVPPLAGSPRPSPNAKRCERGGSTTEASSMSGCPKLTPHAPHNALARRASA